MSEAYDRDFYARANEQAALLRVGRLADADIANIAEEIESMGRSEKRELINRLAVPLLHRLKGQFQPGLRSASWEAAIKVQRNRLSSHLKDNPSLKATLGEVMKIAYEDAVVEAGAETGFATSTFPAAYPWRWDEIMDQSFWPG